MDVNNLCGIEGDDDFEIRDLQNKNVILMLSEDKTEAQWVKGQYMLKKYYVDDF